MAKTLLYSHALSSAAFRVRIALAHKEIPYQYKSIDIITKGEQNEAEYRGVNPMRQVPTLVIDNETLTQSVPIIEYLEETRPKNNLLPDDPVQRAKARAVAEIVNAGIQPLQNLPVVKLIGEWAGKDKTTEFPIHFINRGFQALEQTLKDTAGFYSVGDQLTVADLCLVPQVFSALRRFKMDLAAYPTILGIYGKCLKHPSVEAAHPFNQPDYPKDS